MTKNNKTSKREAVTQPDPPARKPRPPKASSSKDDSNPAGNVSGPPLFFFKEDEENGFLCQWYRCTFADPGLEGLVFNCTEQYMMYKKAILFDDSATAAKIMACTSPRKQKAFGREIANYDEAKWCEARRDIVQRGNILKFSQATNVASMKMDDVGEPVALRELLLATQNRELVEASPFDTVWGIGLKAEEALQVSRARWGQNLLGIALMAVRSALREKQ